MTTKNYLNSLTILQFTFGMGLAFMAIALGYAFHISELIPMLEEKTLYTPINIGIIAYSISIVLSAFYLFGKIVSSIESDQSLFKKLDQFRKGYIVRLALIESSGFLALMAFLLTMSSIPVYVFTASILCIMILKPSRKEIKKSLNLSLEESLMIDQDSSTIINSDLQNLKKGSAN